MLTLDLTNAPHWHDLAPGVRVQLRPLTTALMVATRSDPTVEAVPEDASDEERAVAKESVKSLLGFYSSTPAYRPPMEAVGFGDLQPELNRLSKEGKWEELGRHIDDDFVEAFATSGAPGEIAGKLRDKYGEHADRLAIYAPYAAPDAMWAGIISDLKRG